jgi:TPR repeat protein
LDSSFAVLYLTGCLLHKTGDVNGAVGAFEAAVAHDPANANAFCNLGAVQHIAGDLHAAIGAYQRAIQLDPANPVTRRNLSRVQQELPEGVSNDAGSADEGAREGGGGKSKNAKKKAKRRAKKKANANGGSGTPDVHTAGVAGGTARDGAAAGSDVMGSAAVISKADTALAAQCFRKASLHDSRGESSKAAVWYRKAAELGNADAQQCLAVACFTGDGVDMDVAQAVGWYQKAAEQGHAQAQNCLGLCYKNGDGVDIDAAKAASYFLSAAKLGNARAQLNAGCCYADGFGLGQDRQLAVEWLVEAAEQGHPRAQQMLAVRFGMFPE